MEVKKNTKLLLNLLKYQLEIGVDGSFNEFKKDNLVNMNVSMENDLSSLSKRIFVDSNTEGALNELMEEMKNFSGCSLKNTAKNFVFADGNFKAKIMIIGEAPGREEDNIGKPFVGAAGKLLDKMTKLIGFDRDELYITNVIPWRPPGNRTPTFEEINMFAPFLFRHIQIIKPKIIFSLGGTASKLLLKSSHGIMKIRGDLKKIDFSKSLNSELLIPVLPSFHPAFLLRSPVLKKLSFSDLITLKNFINRS